MSFVPPELIYRVLENEYYAPVGTPNYELLKACMLVCRAWSGPAQALLFRSPPELTTAHTISRFYAKLLSSKTQGLRAFNLGDCVRTLHISIGRTRNRGCCLDEFVKLLQACPRLYELALGFYGISELEEDALMKLKVAGQNLKALRLLSCDESFAFDILNIWPNIQFLEIGCRLVKLPRRAVEMSMLQGDPADHDAGGSVQRPASGAKFCLYELVLCSAPTTEVITWLLASSADSLHILDLQGGTFNWIHTLCGCPHPHLRSLRLSNYNSNSASLLQMCTALEEVVLRCLPTFSLASNLPSTIEHLSFQYDRKWFPLQPIIEAVDALPNLRVLTCGMREEYFIMDRNILNRKCVEKGVEVVALWDTSQVVVVKEDPVMVNRFPRTRSVSNFAAMN